MPKGMNELHFEETYVLVSCMIDQKIEKGRIKTWQLIKISKNNNYVKHFILAHFQVKQKHKQRLKLL